MKYVYGFFTLCLAIFLIDVGLAHYADWRQRVQRERAMRKWGMAAGAFKPVARNWWLS